MYLVSDIGHARRSFPKMVSYPLVYTQTEGFLDSVNIKLDLFRPFPILRQLAIIPSHLSIFANHRVALACPEQYSYYSPLQRLGERLMIKENSIMDWQPAWDKDPISHEDYLQMTSYIYQLYKHALDAMPEDGLALMKTYAARKVLSPEDKTVLNRMGVLNDLEMGRRLYRWLLLDMPQEP